MNKKVDQYHKIIDFCENIKNAIEDNDNYDINIVYIISFLPNELLKNFDYDFNRTYTTIGSLKPSSIDELCDSINNNTKRYTNK
ncbi:MAG: hypothetical protein J6J17_02170 [Bacilli bacterium]|nr:hypothetical protein [Bacilli bacterium]